MDGRVHFMGDTVKVVGIRPVLEEVRAVHLMVTHGSLNLEATLVLFTRLRNVHQLVDKFVNARSKSLSFMNNDRLCFVQFNSFWFMLDQFLWQDDILKVLLGV